MENVVLINSPIYAQKVVDNEDYLPPFGLGYIASQLKNFFNPIILDAVYNNNTIEEIIDILESYKPIAIGINVFSINFILIKEIVEAYSGKTTFIFGGKSVKYLYKEIFTFNTTNKLVVTIGEGDYITNDIIKNCVKEPPFYEEDNHFVYNVDKNSIYFPVDLDKANLDRSFFSGRAILNCYGYLEESIVTSRECLYNCAFCGGSRKLNSSVTVRTRSKENIIKELEYIKSNSPKTNGIRVLDDLFLKNRNSILDSIEVFNQFNYSWRAMCHIKSINSSFDLLPALKNSGCLELEIGIESGNDKIRKFINKIGTTAEIREGIKRILDSGINVKGYIMLGLPLETEKECKDTFDLVNELYEYSLKTEGKFRPSAFQFRPYHGTELYEYINQDLKYSHNETLNVLQGRHQFNFTAGNFSDCEESIIEDLLIRINSLN